MTNKGAEEEGGGPCYKREGNGERKGEKEEGDEGKRSRRGRGKGRRRGGVQ